MTPTDLIEVDHDTQAPAVGKDLTRHYLEVVLRKLRERRGLDALMISCLERGDGSVADFLAWDAAHTAASQAAGAAFVCLGHLSNCEGTA